MTCLDRSASYPSPLRFSGVAWPAVATVIDRTLAICVGRQSLIRSEPQRSNADKVQIAEDAAHSSR
jgi:hypothetical protein